MAEYTHIIHPFEPLYDEHSKILILGSFPSVKSREQQFFYGHPQNRFWKVISTILGEPLPATIEEKSAMLHRNSIALYDVIHECDIIGSSDSSIRNAQVSDLAPILKNSQIGDRIFTNGNTARDLYRRYTLPKLGIDCTGLPSTSPANAAWSLERLTQTWRETLQL